MDKMSLSLQHFSYWKKIFNGSSGGKAIMIRRRLSGKKELSFSFEIDIPRRKAKVSERVREKLIIKIILDGASFWKPAHNQICAMKIIALHSLCLSQSLLQHKSNYTLQYHSQAVVTFSISKYQFICVTQCHYDFQYISSRSFESQSAVKAWQIESSSNTILTFYIFTHKNKRQNKINKFIQKEFCGKCHRMERSSYHWQYSLFLLFLLILLVCNPHRYAVHRVKLGNDLLAMSQAGDGS
jgi:hypothetical protein